MLSADADAMYQRAVRTFTRGIVNHGKNSSAIILAPRKAKTQVRQSRCIRKTKYSPLPRSQKKGAGERFLPLNPQHRAGRQPWSSDELEEQEAQRRPREHKLGLSWLTLIPGLLRSISYSSSSPLSLDTTVPSSRQPLQCWTLHIMTTTSPVSPPPIFRVPTCS